MKFLFLLYILKHFFLFQPPSFSLVVLFYDCQKQQILEQKILKNSFHFISRDFSTFSSYIFHKIIYEQVQLSLLLGMNELSGPYVKKAESENVQMWLDTNVCLIPFLSIITQQPFQN